MMRNLMLTYINPDAESAMRTTVTLDDELFERALSLAEPGTDRSQIFREAFETFVRVQAAKRLAALGGTSPRMATVPRRKTRQPAKA